MAETATAEQHAETTSCFELGLAAERANDLQEAARCYRRGWEEEHDLNAGLAWAQCFTLGAGVPRDFAAAVHLAKEIVDAGCPLGYFILGDAARTGKGMPMNREKGKGFYRRILEETQHPLEGIEESLRLQHRVAAMSLLEEQAHLSDEAAQMMLEIAERRVLPNAISLAALALFPNPDAPPNDKRMRAVKTLIRTAKKEGETLHALAEVMAEMLQMPESSSAAELREVALRMEKAMEGMEPPTPHLMLLCKLWTIATHTGLPPEDFAEAEAHAGRALTRLTTAMRFGASGLLPERPQGLDVQLVWPHGPLMSYAWVYQPDPLQDMAAAEQGYRSDVAAYLRVTNETDETLSHFHVRVCDIANGKEYEADADDEALAPGEMADFSLCMRGLTYSESMYIEVTAGEHRAELDSEGIDLQDLLGYPAPTPAELCWETGFWGAPVLRVFNPGTEPLRVSLSSAGGVPCWCAKTVQAQEEVRFGWYDMMNLRMPAVEECAILHTEGYGDMSLRITPTDRDDNIPGWRDWLDWLLGRG